MRGKAKTTDESLQEDGITPAYAGKRAAGHPPPETRQDHPRLCGEKVDFVHFCTSTTGSPPPMRGKASATRFPRKTKRITPAYAGKSIFGLSNREFLMDHPRLCGEKDTVLDVTVFMPGSPPPMRGKALKTMLKQKRCRITPAYAGKSQRICVQRN